MQAILNIAKMHPHAAYAAFVHGFCSKWTYFLQTISNLLLPLEERLSHSFIPVLTDRCISKQEHALLALPVCLGGLGIRVFLHCCDDEFAAFAIVTLPLVDLILKQQLQLIYV